MDVVLWAIPALLIAPVFLLASPKIPEDVDKQAAGGGILSLFSLTPVPDCPREICRRLFVGNC